MKAHVELVCAPTQDHSGSLMLLHFDERRYMFGHIAEGTQRLRNDTSFKIHRLKDIFLAGKTEWQNTGGIIGMLLTMGDIKISRQLAIDLARAGKPSKEELYGAPNSDGKSTNPYPDVAEPEILTIHGGKNILNTIATARNFVFRENSGVKFHEYDFTKPEDNIVKDEYVTVTPIRTFPRTTAMQGLTSTSFIEEARLRELEDADLGSREQLENIVESMWNSQAGALMVGKDDEDYVASLLSRLKEDEERANRLRGYQNENQSNATAQERHTDGESPPKRQKLDTDEPNDAEAGWDNILDDAPEEPKEVPNFPKDRPLRRPWPATMTRSLPGTIPGSSSVSYIVGIVPARGRFLAEKAKALGVKPGPEFTILANGGSITLPDGTIVESHQCLDPPRKINGVAFLDIPSEEYLESTIEKVDAWKSDMRSKNEHDAIGVWVWALGADLEKNERLLSFIENLEGKHFLNSPTSRLKDMSYKGSASQQARLNLIDDEIFPLPCPEFDYSSAVDNPLDYNSKYLEARSSLILNIHPKEGMETFKIPKTFDLDAVQKEVKMLGDGEYWKSVVETQKLVHTQTQTQSRESSAVENIEFVTLGTGSALPSKYRNVSATVVDIPTVGYLLLDCGEGSLNQLRRAYGYAKAEQVLKGLKILYISHLHADHHLGTISVLKAWYLATVNDDQPTSKLFLIAPSKYLNFLEEYTQIDDIGLKHITFIPCEKLLHREQKREMDDGMDSESKINDMLIEIPLEKVETSYALHCKGSFTVAFTFWEPSGGFKVAYSGDTRPTPGFVKIGKGCTVLLHEATFDDELIGEAMKKKHCTTSEAIQAGKDMGAKNVLLTHFSQRYPKLPNIRKKDPVDDAPLCDPFMETPENKETGYSVPPDGMTIDEKANQGPVVSKTATEDVMNIGFAFDLMRIKVKDFWKLERYIPALGNLFKEEAKLESEEGEDNTVSASASGTPSKKQKKNGKEQQKKGNGEKDATDKAKTPKQPKTNSNKRRQNDANWVVRDRDVLRKEVDKNEPL